MSYKHILSPIALQEYTDAINWYGERSIKAVDEFVIAVNDKITAICAKPTMYRVVHKIYREVSLQKFPFSIVYSINKDTQTIIILSVYHQSRNPKRKYKKP